jgi:hypothetical protein
MTTNNPSKRIIEIISANDVNPKGQIDRFFYSKSLLGYILKRPVIQGNELEVGIASLLSNQYRNIEEIMLVASHNLIFSSDLVARAIVKTFSPSALRIDQASVEHYSAMFLYNALVFYNASFDYLKVLLYIQYSSHAEIVTKFPKKKIEDKISYLKLNSVDWQIALNALITEQEYGNFKKWLKQHANEFPKGFSSLFGELIVKNRKLKNDYQANQLKHGKLPHFEREDRANILGGREFVSLDDFFNKNIKKISFGFHSNIISIFDTQEFLIDYNNLTAKILKLLEHETDVIGNGSI